jgi:hypothetical protein
MITIERHPNLDNWICNGDRVYINFYYNHLYLRLHYPLGVG